MTECFFHLKDGHARLTRGDLLPADRVILRLEGEACGTLLLAGERIAITEEGAHIQAQRLPSGVHALHILADGKRYEGPTVAVFGSTLFFLPPSHTQLAEAEACIEALQIQSKALEKRIAAIERRIQDTHIF